MSCYFKEKRLLLKLSVISVSGISFPPPASNKISHHVIGCEDSNGDWLVMSFAFPPRCCPVLFILSTRSMYSAGYHWLWFRDNSNII